MSKEKETVFALTNGRPSVKFDLHKSKKAALALRALNHKLRQQILKFIDENKETMVTPVYKKLRIEQSVASQHLAILRRAGLVTATRDGKFIKYKVNYENCSDLIKFVDNLIK
ncbi:MAG: helix-turn-helix transcriptional regulator [Bacteroidetes bacterium]|nr:helix-turn-helix transcriptional regulator [Bacteroidota bacterium]MBS1592273.1 helix-turn-helix transcriptional regulator [Bacteroidota bacterium]MBS1640534.1 helix-turn-helix transcriptional regulator [Bacteroidota bacterium]MBS1643352.1 helix-turn-helix transcriptional regulator [Bacteroidota bacterium]MBS1671448.1 helix-turn-helix transcriptional regulator [Bacteroidota bacterium]